MVGGGGLDAGSGSRRLPAATSPGAPFALPRRHKDGPQQLVGQVVVAGASSRHGGRGAAGGGRVASERRGGGRRQGRGGGRSGLGAGQAARLRCCGHAGGRGGGWGGRWWAGGWREEVWGRRGPAAVPDGWGGDRDGRWSGPGERGRPMKVRWECHSRLASTGARPTAPTRSWAGQEGLGGAAGVQARPTRSTGPGRERRRLGGGWRRSLPLLLPNQRSAAGAPLLLGLSRCAAGEQWLRAGDRLVWEGSGSGIEPDPAAPTACSSTRRRWQLATAAQSPGGRVSVTRGRAAARSRRRVTPALAPAQPPTPRRRALSAAAPPPQARRRRRRRPSLLPSPRPWRRRRRAERAGDVAGEQGGHFLGPL